MTTVGSGCVSYRRWLFSLDTRYFSGDCIVRYEPEYYKVTKIHFTSVFQKKKAIIWREAGTQHSVSI